MRKISILIIIVFLFTGCKRKSIVHPTFYYWKTIYKNNSAEEGYLNHFKSKSLYVRMMDVDEESYGGMAIPISPVKFENPLPSTTAIIPVVFITNRIFGSDRNEDLNLLAKKIVKFISAKVEQAGKKDFKELQIDCDWTESTRKNYFEFLRILKADPRLKGKEISVTLRMHQVKNIVKSGIPPVEKAMLMCYNMGNLRKFGKQNSILNLPDMNAYLKDELENYPLKLDVALPLFSWAVVFRNHKYAGISKRIGRAELKDKKRFRQRPNTILYDLLVNDPEAGLLKDDVIRWEEVSLKDLLASSDFLYRYLKAGDRNIVFYHLDSEILKAYNYDAIEKIIDNF